MTSIPRLALTDPPTDRSGLADLSDRASHAMELQSLNGFQLGARSPHSACLRITFVDMISALLEGGASAKLKPFRL